jgi:hypothetical protein
MPVLKEIALVFETRFFSRKNAPKVTVITGILRSGFRAGQYVLVASISD